MVNIVDDLISSCKSDVIILSNLLDRDIIYDDNIYYLLNNLYVVCTEIVVTDMDIRLLIISKWVNIIDNMSRVVYLTGNDESEYMIDMWRNWLSFYCDHKMVRNVLDGIHKSDKMCSLCHYFISG